MQYLLVLAALATAVIALTRLGDLKTKINLLEKRIFELEKKLLALSFNKSPETVEQAGTAQKEKTAVVPETVSVSEPAATLQQIPHETTTGREDVKPETFVRHETTHRNEAVKSDLSETKEVPVKDKKPQTEIIDRNTWKILEQKFVENWTGIIGAAVMVMGVSFIGIYAALKMEPFYRFLMIILFALCLFIVSIIMKRKPDWLNLSGWIRSSSGAILLFSCLGSGWIIGLKWIDSPAQAMSFLVTGIALNIYIGFLGGRQFFAAFHIVLSLITLSIGPQSHISLIIAVVVTLFGIDFSYKNKWEPHLLITILASAAYHFYWYSSMGFFSVISIPLLSRAVGIASVASVGIAACFVHYRKIYNSKEFEISPFLCHLTNWFFMVLGFLLYSAGSKWNTPVLLAASVAAFILARRAKVFGIRWLYITDTLIAQSIAIFGLYTLGRWKIDVMFIAAAMYMEALLFLAVMIKEEEKIFKEIGAILHVVSLVAIISIALALIDFNNVEITIKNSIILAAIIIIQTAFNSYLESIKDKWPEFFMLKSNNVRTGNISISGIFIGILLIPLFLYLHKYIWSGYLLALAGVLLFFIRQRTQSDGLAAGLFIFLTGAHIITWIHILGDIKEDGLVAIVYGLPMLPLSVSCAKWSFFENAKKDILWPGIYLFSIHLAFLCWAASNYISEFLPGIYWLILSVVYLEIAVFNGKKQERTGDPDNMPEKYLLQAAYCFVALFIIRHITVHLQSELYIGIFKLRFLVELFSLIVFFYFAISKIPETLKIHKTWNIMRSLFWELIILFTMLIIALEAPSQWYPAGWILMAITLFAVGRLFSETLSRFRLYSIVFFWMAAFNVAFVSGTLASPSIKLIDQPWVASCLSMLLQFVYIGYFYRKNGLESITSPFPDKLLAGLSQKVHTRMNLCVFYPLFMSIAFFLYWSFDKSILTLLWVLEAFFVFVLSIILRENHFRYLSMGCLVGCLLRLLIYDLSRSSTITRAFVFLGVGILMLAMNSLYNKYKERF